MVQVTEQQYLLVQSEQAPSILLDLLRIVYFWRFVEDRVLLEFDLLWGELLQDLCGLWKLLN